MPKAKTTWGIGDYPEMAERLYPVAEQAAGLADIRLGSRVLDVGCGTGNFARAAARFGGNAVGLDIEPALLAVARSLDGDESVWRESDFGALDADDHAFDVVASIFAVMYATDHRAAVKELARVCAEGGVVVVSAWTPGSLMPAVGRAMAPFLPSPPPSSAPPGHWGDPEKLAAILAEAGLRICSAQMDELPLTFDDSSQAASFLIRTAGHLMAERQRLLADGQWTLLGQAVGAAVDEHLIRTPGGIELRFRYLLVSARADA